ncbi:MAG: LVIVD repeat-containing protein [Gemmatimonadales bacterium]
MMGRTVFHGALAVVGLAVLSTHAAAQADTAAAPLPPAFEWDPNDARVGLGAGWMDAASAIRGLEHLAAIPRPEGFQNPASPGDRRFINSDLAFRGELLYQGNYQGFQVFDISDPSEPQLAVSVLCPGGQGDVSVFGDLVVMSAQESRGRIDCGLEGVADSVSAERLQGIRIFDLSDMRNPRQVAAVQACRGSHTHTLVTDPDDPANLYVYIQGTGGVRPASELAGCSSAEPDEDPNTSRFRIEVVRVPLAAPERAEIVSMPRIFADPATGDIAGLWSGGDHGPGTQRTSQTTQCHDITAYPELGLAAGACSGNGIILDIRDPVNPVRIDEVMDPNFAYWHSATFSNDGSKVVFTDEWGGGTAPRCRASDPPTWGADAFFTRGPGGRLELAGYYKLPVPQTETENCVAHNGSLIPVPGRDIMVQGWYQGGLSVVDFTDPRNPVEIAYFDRGPISQEEMFLGGYWSTYWYNGRIYGAEIARGIDVFRLMPSEHLSEAEIAAAESVHLEQFNAQLQPHYTWPATATVARAYLDQMVRGGRILEARAAELAAVLERADAGRASATELRQAAARIDADVAAIQAGTLGGDRDRLIRIAEVLRTLAG